MSILANSAVIGGGTSGIDTGDIQNSLRFRSAASASLTRTITTDATSTYFAAVKRGQLGVISPIFDTNIRFNANDTLTAFGLTTTAVFRDPTSWLFIHVSNGGLYVNGVSYGAVTTSAITNPRIGFNGTNYFDGYMARVGVVAGSSSSYTNFGYLNTEINEWVSKTQSAVKAVVDAGGTNSFMLDFDDATSLTTLGYDKSSKGNNWTCNNISLTAGVTYDHMLDVPGNSYCTYNPLQGHASATVSNGNLTFNGNGGSVYRSVAGSIPVNKFDCYWEMIVGVVTNNYVGVAKAEQNMGTQSGTAFLGFAAYPDSVGYRELNGDIYKNGSITLAEATPTAGDVLMFAVQASTGKLFIGRNGTWFNSGDPSAGTGAVDTLSTSSDWVVARSNSVAGDCSAMFGQAPLHASATYHSAAGGYFRYAPPTGYKALCQANLPDIAPATLLDPTDHHIDITVTKSGDTNFTLPWSATTFDTFFEIKRRDAAGDWYQIDGLRGYDKILKSNSTAAETTDANVLGVSGTTCTLRSTLPNGTYIISATKAGLVSARQTNTSGTITSTVSRNVDSGFSIVSANGTAANATVGHGLGAVLKYIVGKARAAVTEWPVYHTALAATEYLVLNTTTAKATGATYWNSTAPTTTVFSLGSSTNTNNTGGMIFYCYADSPIQKSFSYTGDANAVGVYADLGFKMGRTLLKCSSTTGNWTALDSARSPDNVVNEVLYENLNNIEAASNLADFTSRGIKFRIATDPNSAQTFIGHAWAAVTGKYSLAR